LNFYATYCTYILLIYWTIISNDTSTTVGTLSRSEPVPGGTPGNPNPIPPVGTPTRTPPHPPPPLPSSPLPHSTLFSVPPAIPIPGRRPPTMMVGGLNIPMRTTTNVSTSDTQILYPKSLRNTTTQENFATLFSVAVKKHHTLYDFMPLTLTDEDKLDDTNSLEMLIKQTFHRDYEFEMQDVLQNMLH
jgi:hypothetical protein